MEQEQKPKKSIFKKWWFWTIIVVLLVFIALGSTSQQKETENNNQAAQPTTNSQPVEAGDNNQQVQKEEFLKIYQDFIEPTYQIRKTFYYANQFLTLSSRQDLYNMFKKNEELYKDYSVYFTLGPIVPPSLKEYKNDFEQSSREMANACVILQEYSKYMADYINTANLESDRKASQQLKQEPFKMMANATSRLVYGLGEKIGVDTQQLNDEYKAITDRVEQEFKNLFSP